MEEHAGNMDFERFWKRLQQLGLNAYESRSYLVLLGHPRFKALELAARSNVPRQKIYEVLDGLIEKGFAQMVQERTKLFSAVEPALAIPSYLARKRQLLEYELTGQDRVASAIVEDLRDFYAGAKGGRGTLDFLRIVSEPVQTAAEYREMLRQVTAEYLEFSRPPYAVDPLEERMVRDTAMRGVSCRLLVEAETLEVSHIQQLREFARAGVGVRKVNGLPLKLAVFDGERGLVALLDPVVTKPVWASVVFDHRGMGEAMKGLFEDYWKRAEVF